MLVVGYIEYIDTDWYSVTALLERGGDVRLALRGTRAGEVLGQQTGDKGSPRTSTQPNPALSDDINYKYE